MAWPAGKKPKTGPMAFRPEPELKEALLRAAEADQRSPSSLIHKIVKEWAGRNGWLKDQQEAR